MNLEKKVAFYTLGCKLNFSETSTIARNFTDEGFKRVPFEDTALIKNMSSMRKKYIWKLTRQIITETSVYCYLNSHQ